MPPLLQLPATALSGVSLECGAIATLRDGTRLVADIYRPAEASRGPWPVLLMRQPYGRDIASTVVYAHPTWFARRGFMVVIQDVRGRGDSEGNFHAFKNEINDGYDSVLWAAALPGSNGRVGMYGFSYQGSTQLLAAVAQPPPLKALAPHMTAFDLYSGWFYRDGILQLSTTLGWASQMLREDSRRLESRDAEKALDANWLNSGALSQAMPLRHAAPLVHPDLPRYAADWLGHTTYDEHWRELDLLHRIESLALPMFHLSGWYDFYLRGSVDGYTSMAARHPNQFLLAAPWGHLPWGPQLGSTDFGPAARPEVDEQMAAWFHHWLDHDTPVGLAPLQGCKYFVLGENAWRDSASWPPPEASEKVLYIASAGQANSRFGDGLLTEGGASGDDDMFSYDPEVPVTAPGGNLGGHAGFGPHELSAQQQALNLLVYTSKPLPSAQVIAGAIRCVLYVHSSATLTDFVVRLSRVTSEGRAIFLSLGAARAEAQEGQEITLTLDPVAVRFAAGESIRIDIASSAFPLLVRNPNTGVDPVDVARPAEFRRALQVVHHDAAHPSRLILPVLPA